MTSGPPYGPLCVDDPRDFAQRREINRERSDRHMLRRRYAHGVAVANSRLIAVDRAGVTFKRKNYRIRAATDTSR